MTKDEQWLLEEKYGGVATKEFDADKERLAAGEPLAYIIGWQPFLGLKIFLDSHPLIPRTETEWWVEQFLQNTGGVDASARKESHSATAREEAIRQQAKTPLSSSGPAAKPVRFLDLCAGSGAIGCAALVKLPNAHVYFGEIDPTHEATILKNLCENNLDGSCADVRVGDLFGPFGDIQFDFIAANPPYIPSNRPLPESVAGYEPSRALYAGADGLDVIRRIATDLSRHLAPGGEAWIEVDSPATPVATGLFTDQGFRANVRNDQYGLPRVLVVSFP